jgi:hypothetical protein
MDVFGKPVISWMREIYGRDLLLMRPTCISPGAAPAVRFRSASSPW